MGSYTRSGRRYDTVSEKAQPVKGKAPMVEEMKEKVAKFELPINKLVNEEEAKEFLKFLKHSEYSVAEQLRKQPARISVLAVLLSSEVYRSALINVLNETYVANDISVNKLDRLVINISADNFIFFNDDEIPPGGRGSTKALHITTRCKGYTLLGVLIDNGSALNVLSLTTLNRLPIDSSHMKECQNIVKAVDGTESRVIGRIEVPLLIGPNTYEVDFLLMDIKPSYNCLLGRPWIHSVGAVPSSLHQKLKLVFEGRLITINAEEDIIAAVSSNALYLETDDEAIECLFQSLEFVNTTGLGRHLQGKVETPVLKDKRDHFGQEFKSDARQRKKELEKKQERRRARLTVEEIKWEPMIFRYISKTFLSRGVIHPERGTPRKEAIEKKLGSLDINATYEEGAGGENLSGICPYIPGSVLDNWTAEEISVVYRADSE
ncbi:uncharacterized protein LOC108485206 [Gossypium arboreum]|uniref:uncharacterized protein LOC108485206 n=1 Tax=Gossypium arboreum TaxID=29729 RepID=UPI0008192E68|nr:uncharacterized protein LOC108485206 [Gossypium arboreum]